MDRECEARSPDEDHGGVGDRAEEGAHGEEVDESPQCARVHRREAESRNSSREKLRGYRAQYVDTAAELG